MSETCYGQVTLARSAFTSTPSISDLSEVNTVKWPSLPYGFFAQYDISIFNQVSRASTHRQLDSIEQDILHEAHMKSVELVSGVIRL